MMRTREVITNIVIEADRVTVWQVLTNAAAYPQWNPVVRRVRGEFRAGRPISFVIRVGGVPFPIAAEVIRADGHELRWAGPRGATQNAWASGSHFFRLEPLSEKTTRVVHGEQFDGHLVRPLWPVLWRLLRPAYDDLNHALKRRVERGA